MFCALILLHRTPIAIEAAFEKRGALLGDLAHPYFVLNEESVHPFIFNSAHSGRHYPDSFLNASRLDALAIRKSEDAFVEELFLPAACHQATLIHALFPRAFLDLNREPFELDPQLFDEALPDYANTGTARVLGGLGTIARVVTETDEIYETSPSLAEALDRITRYYIPYHQRLAQLIGRAKEAFGFAILIDCHSMPSLSTVRATGGKPDFVLGDRYGISCDSNVIQTASALLTDLGYSVARNIPYAGGYTTEHYGDPENNVHALQIEINRGLYMNEHTLEKLPCFDSLRRDLEIFSVGMMERVPQFLCNRQLAAE